ncbi:MAG TPA: Holliday junction branch migration protein RuvA [Chitinophagaceae bacterium]|nr:Holliday junction branch migration protein RuvA [Chitinophagaceae bacterium]
MIAYLKGDFVYKSPAVVQVDVNGVGYEVFISLNTYSKIQNLDKGLLHTCLLIREDAHILIGFFDPVEKEMFLHLISVSGIGATTARIMLSYMKPEELVRAIVTADLRTLESIKGIGKKTAERMVLELKDKLAKHPVNSNFPALKYNTLHADALNALMALGIARNTAEQAVQKVTQSDPSITSIEDVIKRALKIL